LTARAAATGVEDVWVVKVGCGAYRVAVIVLSWRGWVERT
jgi:hypothetical protein